MQAELAVRAARAGRHLLLDKPLATTVAQGRAVVDAVEAAGVASVVFFTTRFQPEPQAWIEEQARVGGWFTGRAQWLGAVFTVEDNPFAASPWRQEKGALWDVGPHALSVLLPVLGEPRRVTAAAYGPGDTVHLVLDHAGGASSGTTLSLTAPAGRGGRHGGAAGRVRGDRAASGLGRRRPGARPGRGRADRRGLPGEPHPCDARFACTVTSDPRHRGRRCCTAAPAESRVAAPRARHLAECAPDAAARAPDTLRSTSSDTLRSAAGALRVRAARVT